VDSLSGLRSFALHSISTFRFHISFAAFAYSLTTCKPTARAISSSFHQHLGVRGGAAPADLGHIGRHYGRTEAISKPPRMPERNRLGDEAVFMCGNPSPARREHAFALTVDGCWAVRSRLFNGTHDTGSRVCVCVCVCVCGCHLVLCECMNYKHHSTLLSFTRLDCTKPFSHTSQSEH
jgi:hypothetical protein